MTEQGTGPQGLRGASDSAPRPGQPNGEGNGTSLGAQGEESSNGAEALLSREED